MKKQDRTDALNAAIDLLQSKQTEELNALKDQFNVAYESLKPINLIKNTLHEVATLPSDTRNDLLHTAVGVALGYFSKVIFVGTSSSPTKKMMGTLIQLVVTNVITKNAGAIITYGENLFERIFKKDQIDKA
jgi:hypothetical protein